MILSSNSYTNINILNGYHFVKELVFAWLPMKYLNEIIVLSNKVGITVEEHHALLRCAFDLEAELL